MLFIARENTRSIKKNGYHGTPDLIIEILSPSNEQHDNVKKKGVYEKTGVKEYWVIDPETKIATGYEWKEGKYYEPGTSAAKLPSKLLRQTFSF